MSCGVILWLCYLVGAGLLIDYPFGFWLFVTGAGAYHVRHHRSVSP
jgi:hypothetical protein